MKIGILTIPFNNNYGGFLQAYALTTVLRRMGHEVVIINRKRNLPFRTKLRKFVTFGIASRYEKMVKKISVNTDRFIAENLKTTHPLYSTKAIRRECVRQRFDCLIVGSDQVWRYKYAKKSVEDYFFGFLDVSDDTPRFSYAASFGVDIQEYPIKVATYCGKFLKKFRAVSVREESAVALLEKHFFLQRLKAVVVVDPTFLLKQQDYQQLTIRYATETRGDYLFKYVLDETEDTIDICAQFQGKLCLPCQEIKAQTGNSAKQAIIEPVEKWVAEIACAKFVVTDSYHGTIFSILFNRPFVVVTNSTRGLTRIHHLLSHYHLTERMISESSAEVINEAVYNPIDWTSVNKQIIEDRAYSMDFIRRSLPS